MPRAPANILLNTTVAAVAAVSTRVVQYEANKEDPEEVKKREGRDKIRAKMQRYLHYFEQYVGGHFPIACCAFL